MIQQKSLVEIIIKVLITFYSRQKFCSSEAMEILLKTKEKPLTQSKTKVGGECESLKLKQHHLTVDMVKTVNNQNSTTQSLSKEEKNQQSQGKSILNHHQRSFEFSISPRKDEHRHELAHKDGGITCDDPKQIDKLRSVGKEMIKLIGRKILSGEFNLTKISIPIKSCYPKTALYNSIKGYRIFPYFMKTAAQCNDPMERFKITLSCLVAQPYYLNMFLKPLNPILGQTLQCQLADGTKVYVQQVSHHPPISYFLIYGPNESYRFSGYYDVEVSPNVNSLKIRNKGKRKFQFQDGTVIETNYSTNEFSGTFFGTSRVEELHSFVIEDHKNQIRCEIEFDKVKGKPSDYFFSQIQHKGTKMMKIQGTYLGYISINGVKYWDGRDINPDDFIFEPLHKRLPSDWQHRPDLQQLEKNNLQIAQKFKQQLEERQRQDRKLRKQYQSKKEHKN